MDRRQFIKVTAITGTTAALARCGHPEHQIIRFIPDEELVPGVAVWKPSICPLCPARCGVIVRVMDGDVEVVRNGQAGVTRMGLAKKLEGNPADPMNKGKLCARGQAAIQLTYHPDRIGQPLKRTGPRGSGQFQAITWDEALADLVGRLDALATKGLQASLGFITRSGDSLRGDLIAQFLTRFGAPPPIAFELFDDDVLRRANALSFGHEQMPTPDLAASRYVVSFAADFLGTWNAPVAQTIGFANMRQGRAGVRGKFVQVEARMSLTGASADEWIPVRPGMEGVVALGMAHVIVTAGLRRADAAGRAGRLVDGWSSGLADFTPAAVEQRTGLPAARLERLAREFAEHGPAVALIGGAPLAHTNGLFNALAVNALNALAGSIGTPGGIFFTPRAAPATAAGATIAALLTPKQPLEMLLVDAANPVFVTPPAWRVREAIEKVPFIASFGCFLDETSVLADLILPDHSFLESWVAAQPSSGAAVPVAKFASPAMRPLHDTRPTPDVLLDVARRLQKPLNPALPWQTFEEMLHATFDALPAAKPSDPAADASAAWTEALARGSWIGEAPAATLPASSSVSGGGAPMAFTEPQFDGDAGEYPFHFLPFVSPMFLDGSVAHLPWLQETPDPLTSAMWSSWVEINPHTAAGLQIADGDVVEIRSAHGAVQAAALLSPGIAPDVIAMPAGQGHQTFTRYASGRGANPVAILAPLTEPQTGAVAWAATRVRVQRVSEADGRLILFAGATRERPHEREVR